MNTPRLATLVLAALGAVAACAKAPDTGGGADDPGSEAGAGDDTGTSSDASPGSGPETASGSDTGGGVDAGADVRDSAAVCIPTDAGCTTASPGACAAGAMDCDDAGVPYCRPTVTSQACYSGAPATRGVGPCKDGVQTCTGTLGTCTGEVVPTAYENCFNVVDDDCDGKMNNGCPDHLALGAPTPLAAQGGNGGSATTALCPPNAFVTRSVFYFDHGTGHAAGVAIYCAAPQLVQGASSYSVTLTPVAPQPYTAAIGGNASSPDGNYDCGITGLVAGSYIVGQSDNFVEGLGMHCSTGVVNLAANNTLSFVFTEGGQTDYLTYPGGVQFRDDCPAGQVLIGYNVRDGAYLDQIQAVCAPLVTVYK